MDNESPCGHASAVQLVGDLWRCSHCEAHKRNQIAVQANFDSSIKKRTGFLTALENAHPPDEVLSYMIQIPRQLGGGYVQMFGYKTGVISATWHQDRP